MESTESKLSKGVDIDEEFNVVRVPVNPIDRIGTFERGRCR